MPWSVNIGNWGGIPMWHLISYLCPLIKHTVLLLYVLAWFKEVLFFFHVCSCYKDSMGPPGVGPCFTHKTGLPGVPLDARSFCTKSLSLYYTRWQWISIFYLTILSHSHSLCLAFFLIIHIFILSHSQSFCTILSHSQYLCFTLSWCCIPSVSHQDLHQVQEPSRPDMGAVGSGPKIDSTWQIISGPVWELRGGYGHHYTTL